jgi:F420-dependent oxidoreductase-like protein
MSLTYSVHLPLGCLTELAEINNPVEASETLIHVAQTADEEGYETLWLADHLQTALPEAKPSATFECWTTTAALARSTKRVRLGQLATGNSYRHPALLAKMASTVDVLSHGRLTVGIGAGWYEPEYRAYGYPYPSAPERVRQLREAIQVLLAMWTQEEATFEGQYYQVRGAINQPKGVQHPHIPLLIAGSGEQVILRLVAQYGDACNVLGDPATVRQKFDVLKTHCASLGRDYEQIRRTTLAFCVLGETDKQARASTPKWMQTLMAGVLNNMPALIGSPETIRRSLGAYEEVGVQEIALTFSDPTPETLRRFANTFMR